MAKLTGRALSSCTVTIGRRRIGLSRDIRQELAAELRSRENSSELKRLLLDVLEELKVNYVQQAQQHDPEATLQEVNTLHLTATQ